MRKGLRLVVPQPMLRGCVWSLCVSPSVATLALLACSACSSSSLTHTLSRSYTHTKLSTLPQYTHFLIQAHTEYELLYSSSIQQQQLEADWHSQLKARHGRRGWQQQQQRWSPRQHVKQHWQRETQSAQQAAQRQHCRGRIWYAAWWHGRRRRRRRWRRWRSWQSGNCEGEDDVG